MSSKSVIQQIDAKQMKKHTVDVRSGDTVKVRQKIREGEKERIQVFEGVVIRVSRPGSLTASLTVRRVASGVGVEKTFPIHSPAVIKIEITKRSKVRRNYISYLRQLSGKGTRLTGVEFDRDGVNAVTETETEAEVEEAKIKEEQAGAHEAEAAAKAEQESKAEAKAEAAIAKHQE
ncbi:50S ribosomal protein L19 [Candidatus Saccharibacteria bacterium]|nr:50S ribosomal protein L19 [Candidatus Saccharibacteria bacterium]